jgi:hypothetical protein
MPPPAQPRSDPRGSIRARWHARPAEVVIAAGLLVGGIGAFLPWLRSGSTTRNSYTSDGALRGLLDPGGTRGAILDGWPFVGLASAISIALLLLGFTHLGAALALLASATAGGVAIWALNVPGRFLIHAESAGPRVTLAGAALTWLALVLRYLPLHRLPAITATPQGRL